MSKTPPSFLIKCVSLHDASTSRPHITLTWAQSLDFKIAGPDGSRVILSGPESMEMTHWMRSMHDAILVGINTIILDDPRLQIQLVLKNASTLIPPQPLILDPQLRFPLTSRILSEWNTNPVDSRKCRQPWLICDDRVDPVRLQKIEAAGARVIPVPLDAKGRIPPNALPGILKTLGLKSVMIEGGSRVLSSFLQAPAGDDGRPLVDIVVVTVAPMFIGEGIGVVPQEDEKGLLVLETVHTETMGKDAVMVCSIRR